MPHHSPSQMMLSIKLRFWHINSKQTQGFGNQDQQPIDDLNDYYYDDKEDDDYINKDEHNEDEDDPDCEYDSETDDNEEDSDGPEDNDDPGENEEGNDHEVYDNNHGDGLDEAPAMADESIEHEGVENTGVNPNDIDAPKIPGVNLEAIDEGEVNNEESEENSDKPGIGDAAEDGTNVGGTVCEETMNSPMII